VSTEQNLALVRRYFSDCVSGASGPQPDRALALVDELLGADFAMYYNSDTEADALRGRERHREFLVEHARWFPDDRWTIEAIVADQDMAACQWRFRGKHVETGNAVDVRAADIYRIRNGQLVELRRFLDFKSFNDQVHGAP
jgi:ketosteroid isomerase-like protein